MSAIIFAFVTFLTWGSGDIFTTIASRKMGAYSASFYGYFFGFLPATLYIPFALSNLHSFSLPMVFLTIFLAIIQLIAFYAYNVGLKISNASLVGTISGSFTAMVVILSVLFLGERLLFQQVIAIVIIIVGLFFASINLSDIKNKKSFFNKGVLYAFIAMIGWAIYFTFIKIPIKEAGTFFPTYLTDVVGTLAYLVFGLRKIKIPKITTKSGFPAALMSGLLLTGGSFAFNFAIGQGLSSVVASIAGAYPALFALLASLVFKDPITRQQKSGMVVTLMGIVLLAYFSI
jgi:drug/metabolite transporter (DMT)-like permease